MSEDLFKFLRKEYKKAPHKPVRSSLGKKAIELRTLCIKIMSTEIDVENVQTGEKISITGVFIASQIVDDLIQFFNQNKKLKYKPLYKCDIL